jgi:hypothetical protein
LNFAHHSGIGYALGQRPLHCINRCAGAAYKSILEMIPKKENKKIDEQTLKD